MGYFNMLNGADSDDFALMNNRTQNHARPSILHPFLAMHLALVGRGCGVGTQERLSPALHTSNLVGSMTH